MTFSTNADTVRNFCDTLAGKVVTDALVNLKNESNSQILSDKVRTMNGRILTNHVNHLDNFKKLQENDLISSENAKNSSKNITATLSSDRDNEKLGTIKEEVQDTNNNESSGDEDVSSLTSDTDSDSDATLSNSSDGEVEFFPVKKSRNRNDIHSDQLEKTIQSQDSGPLKGNSHKSATDPKPSTSEGTSNSSNKVVKNSHDETNNSDHGAVGNNENTEGHTKQNNLIIQSPNKVPRKLSPLDIKSHRNGENQKEKDQVDGNLMSNTELQLIPSTSNYDELLTSGSSDVVIPSARNPPDLIKGNLNSSGGVSDDSDLKDHARILAELQKIVQDDEMHDGKDVAIDENVRTESVVKGSSQSNELKGRNDGGSHTANTSTGGTSNGAHKTGDAKIDGTNSGFQKNNHDGKSTMVNDENDHQNKVSHDGYKDGAKLQTNSHGSKNDTTQGQRTNVKAKGIKTRSDTSNSPHTTPNSSNTSLQTPSTQPTNFSNQNHSLENLERKLSNLQISNTEQTAEIRRLKELNQTLKAKFEKLEQSSSFHQNIDEKMLQRNQELEKHLLGMLKSQEIIFDMKENLKAASADNEKLAKDYKEALKALEAVDKLFGQKDALVKKWKEATDESRQLVELLKKHNAETGDLETVDKLKEQILELKDKFMKEEEKNRRAEVKIDELNQQSKAWKEKYERENEHAIKLNFELQEVSKELKNHQKLAGKRGRKNQILQLEITELKDTLKLAKEKLVENEQRLKELERKHATTQEMYTKIIHEKEKQHSVLINNSESYQKDLKSNMENSESVRKESESLKQSIVALEKEKTEIAEKLKDNEKSLEETLNKKAELGEQLAKLQSDFEASKIEAVDNELYTEEQAERLQELENQCRQLQHVLKQYIHSNGSPRNRRPRTAPNRYSHGKKLRPSQTWPSQLDMYRQLLSPPRGVPRRKHSPKREARYKVQITDKNNDSEDTFDDVTQKFDESSKRISYHPNRPKSTYGNRSLSTNNNEDGYREHSGKDWVPKIVLVDSQKLEASSEHDSGGVSADQYAMQYVKLGDRVLFELAVDGKKQNIPGTVKYVGPVYHSNFKSGVYAGLKLDIPAGDTNGTIGDRLYFRCLKNHGKFVKLAHILAVQNPRTQQYTRLLPMAYK